MKKLLILAFLLFVTGHVHAAETYTPVSAQSYVQGITGLGQGAAQNPCQAAYQGAPTGGNLRFCPLEPLAPYTSLDASGSNFTQLFNTFFRLAIAFGAFLAVVMLVIGGVQYMTSTAVGTKADGLERARAALIGIVILAGSFLILNTINPNLLIIKLNPSQLTNPTNDPQITVTTAGTQTSAKPTNQQIQDCETVQKGKIYYDSSGNWDCYPTSI